ncbi:unnamed protein product [Onchocerca flexuosa]|uniref:Abhydro_lipase domain-containing protein n=1 Tax=Onchocerca flexuosa TaxID=387005 RepID=A0A183HWM2_9BILA|nr:unnamed protein product [Onchocerca flexuosa]
MLKQILFCEIIRLINAYFTNDFNFWLTEVYGSDVQATLDRPDLGPVGSFGGKRYRNQKLTKNPIIFVHGVSNTAGEQPLVGASYFLYVFHLAKKKMSSSSLSPLSSLSLLPSFPYHLIT